MVLLWTALGAGAAPVELPPEVPAAEWASPLALAGLRAGPVGDVGPGARIGADADRWWVWVRGEDGTEHVLQVPAPADRAGREALAALVASLVRPVALPDVALPENPDPGAPAAHVGLPPAPPPRMVEATPGSPRPVAVTARPKPPSAEARDPAPIRALPASPGTASPAGTPRPAAWRGWAGFAPSLRMRPTVRSTAAAGVWAGVAGDVGAPVRFGLGLEAAAPAALPRLDAASRLSAVDFRAAAVWAPGPWEVGPAVALSVRVLSDPRGPPLLGPPHPTLGAVLARRIPAGAGAIRLQLLVERDLVPSLLHDEDGSVERLQPVSAGLGLGLWTE